MTFDTIIVIIFVVLILAGIRAGLIMGVGSLVGLGLGFWMSGKYYMNITSWLMSTFKLDDTIGRIISFVVIFIVISKLTSIVFWLIKKVWHIIPFGGLVDHVAGGVIGALEGVLILGFMLQFALSMPIKNEWKQTIKDSRFTKPMISSAVMLWPIVEENIKKAEILNKIE